MKEIDIIQQIKFDEVSRVQFKERLLDSCDIGCELVAFSNACGGTLVIGVKDKTGNINPLSYQEVQETTSLLGNIASENVVSGILVDAETNEPTYIHHLSKNHLLSVASKRDE